jgi:hypothetical protein
MFDPANIQIPDTMNLKPFCTPAILLGIAACATAKPAETGTTAAPSASVSAAGKTIRWSGTLQPTQQVTGGLGPTGQNKTFGTVTLTSKGSERMAAEISLSTPLQSSTSLNWAILPGRCGTGSLPLAAVERFPVIDVGNNGRGQLHAEMALALPESGAFHVNVYWGGGQQLSDVMTCANLRRD